MSTPIYYSRVTKTFGPTQDASSIAVPTFVLQTIQGNIAAGKPIAVDADGNPSDVMALLTLDGMRAAVLNEMRAQRSYILNALTGVGYDAIRAGDTAMQAAVDGARSFLKNLPADPDVLAVTVAQGAEYMRQLILSKYVAYVSTAPSAIRNAFREVS